MVAVAISAEVVETLVEAVEVEGMSEEEEEEEDEDPLVRRVVQHHPEQYLLKIDMSRTRTGISALRLSRALALWKRR